MAIPVEGYSVIAKFESVSSFLDDGAIEIPNATSLADDDIWRCCFMSEADAIEFVDRLEKLGLNGSTGPESDIVIVNEFDQSINPYCEWLTLAKWEKAVIAWKAGTNPESIVAREGWDPKVGSGLIFESKDNMDHLEFQRLDGNVEVYLNKKTGEEVFIGRTETPTEAMFKEAGKIVTKYMINPGQKHLEGDKADQVREAIGMLEKVIDHHPEFWNAYWLLGKGHSSIGDDESAYSAFQKAYEFEKENSAVSRELAGCCLILRKFDEAVQVAEKAVALEPDNHELLGNLAVSYLLSGQNMKAKKAIDAAVKQDSNDGVNKNVSRIIEQVISGERPQPDSLDSLSRPVKTKSKEGSKSKWWEFWKK